MPYRPPSGAVGQFSVEPSGTAYSRLAESRSKTASSAIRFSAVALETMKQMRGDASAGMVDHRSGDAGGVLVDEAGDGADAGIARRLRLGKEFPRVDAPAVLKAEILRRE